MHVECSTTDPTWFEDLKNIMNSGSFNLRNVRMYVGNFEVGRPCLWIIKSRGLKTRILALRRILLSTVRLFGNGWSALTMCKNVERLRLKTGLFLLKIAACQTSVRYNTHPSLPSLQNCSSKFVLQSTPDNSNLQGK